MKNPNQLFSGYPRIILWMIFSFTLSCQPMSIKSIEKGEKIRKDGLTTTTSLKNSNSKVPSEKKMMAMIEESVKIWNHGELGLLGKLYAPEYVGYHTDGGDKLVGLNAVQDYVISMRRAYPDITVKIDKPLIKDDMSVTRWTFTGTNKGTIGKNPATGKSVRISGVTIGRFFAGKITKEWAYWDNASVLQQLGYTFFLSPQNRTKQLDKP